LDFAGLANKQHKTRPIMKVMCCGCIEEGREWLGEKNGVRESGRSAKIFDGDKFTGSPH